MNPANYPADLADRLFAFETGELDEKETLQFFADLVASGWAWHLEGLYGRMAASLIEGGFISEDGEVIWGVMVVSGLREEASGASTGEAREVARKPADALPG